MKKCQNTEHNDCQHDTQYHLLHRNPWLNICYSLISVSYTILSVITLYAAMLNVKVPSKVVNNYNCFKFNRTARAKKSH